MVFTPEIIVVISAIVASYVTVFKAFKVIDTRFLPIVALIIAAYFVLIPEVWYTKSIVISTIGLMASGVYQMNKNKDNK